MGLGLCCIFGRAATPALKTFPNALKNNNGGRVNENQLDKKAVSFGRGKVHTKIGVTNLPLANPYLDNDLDYRSSVGAAFL